MTVVQMSPAAIKMTGRTGGEEEWRDREREEYPLSDKHYSGTSMSNQIQSTELDSLTSTNKVDSLLVRLQGIHQICKTLACWSAYLLKHNLKLFCIWTLFYDLFHSDQIQENYSTAASVFIFLFHFLLPCSTVFQITEEDFSFFKIVS